MIQVWLEPCLVWRLDWGRTCFHSASRLWAEHRSSLAVGTLVSCTSMSQGEILSPGNLISEATPCISSSTQGEAYTLREC